MAGTSRRFPLHRSRKPVPNLLRPGHVYKHFKTANGTKVTLRAVKPEDLDPLLSFINRLVNEKRQDKGSLLYSGFDDKVKRIEEKEWLAETLEGIRRSNLISVLAEIDGKIIANGEVTRGRYDETRHHGHLGLTMISEFRGKGIGRKVIGTLVKESRRAGLRSLEVEFLASTKNAQRAYNREGFRPAGVIPGKIFRRGKYFDGLIMARKL